MSIWADYGYTGMVWGLWLCAVTVPLLGVASSSSTTAYAATGSWSAPPSPSTPRASSPSPCYRSKLQKTLCAAAIRCAPHPSTASSHSCRPPKATRSPSFLPVTPFSKSSSTSCSLYPLGFLARAVFKRGLFTSTLIAFSVSFAIELTQLTGLWGYYPCAYRIFDVDDLITNTLGGLIGATIALVWIALRPRDEKPLPWGSGARPRSSAEDDPAEEAH